MTLSEVWVDQSHLQREPCRVHVHAVAAASFAQTSRNSDFMCDLILKRLDPEMSSS